MPFPDAAIDVISQAAAAFIRRYAGDAWAAVAPAEPIVRKVFTHDPGEYDLSAKDLPALYVFSSGSWKDSENLSDDMRLTYDRVMIQWVMPPTKQMGLAVRSRAFRRVAKLIDTAFERGRDPSFVVDGDTDPRATIEGSVIILQAGLYQIFCTRWMSGNVAIRDSEDETGRKHTLYPMIATELHIAEQFDERPDGVVPAALGPAARIYAPARADVTITSNGSDATAVEYRDPKTGWTP